MNKGLIEVLDELYFDPDTGTPKTGVVSQDYPLNEGTLLRFMGPNSFYDQYHSTHDFRTMNKTEIIELLKESYPDEFNAWLPPAEEEQAA